MTAPAWRVLSHSNAETSFWHCALGFGRGGKARRVDKETVRRTGKVCYVDKVCYIDLDTVRDIGNIETEFLHQSENLAFEIMDAYRFAESRCCFEMMMRKKLRATTNPEKPPKKINKN